MQYGFWSVVPPILTIVLALVTKNVFISLLIGIFTSSMVLCGGAPLTGLNDTFYSFIHTFESNGNTITLISFLLIGALIYLIEKSGGVEGFTDVMLKKRALIKTKRGANIFTWLLGIIIFTSGSLSCMVTGSVSRPFNDALKVPHEKSAFIVHATSTPWCVLFPLSGWLAALAGYLTSGGVPENEAISVLLRSIPLNFYCILAVFGTLAVSLFRINIGPMRKAEERADKTGALDNPGRGGAFNEETAAPGNAKPRVLNMFLPMGVLIVTILAVLTICILCVAQKQFSVDEVINEMFKGMGTMLPVAGILLFGFTMGNLVKSLDTGNDLTSVFMGVLSPALLPALSFLLCMLLSFATGTSMGTMAIMSVICLPMAISMGISIPLVAGAVFGGSIFGDHSSPISDTTIMSCATTGCDIIDHVKTQMPYVLIFAVISLVLYAVLGFVM